MLHKIDSGGLSLVVLFFICVGCKSAGKVKTSIPVKINKLDQNYNLQSELGVSEYEITDNDSSLRLSLGNSPSNAEIAIIFFPEDVDGELVFKLRASQEILSGRPEYGEYIDSVLILHRILMRGNLKEFNVELDQFKQRFGESFGFFYLKGSYLALTGNLPEAYKLFAIASELNPEVKEVAEFAEKLKNRLGGGGG